jgi:ribonuclease HI
MALGAKRIEGKKMADKKDEPADWKRMQFRRNKVWLALDAEGKPLEKNGKVLIKYQLNQSHEYWVHADSVTRISERLQKKKTAPKKRRRPRKPPPATNGSRDGDDENTLVMFTDGASSGNPGPSGIGVLLRYRRHEKEISRYIGRATNNIAELKAILAGLRAVKDRDLPVRVYTDSNYAYGLLVLGWKARTNVALVEKIRREMELFGDLEIKKIKGHAGHEGNERADRLATGAISRSGEK